MLMQLSPHQARVIGVLIEKEITTPDQYPLSLNAITLGCNQKSSRDPVMQLAEHEVQDILDELRQKNLLFEHQSSGSRVVKYKHRFCNTEFSSLKFTPQELAIICVLLLRGPQTPGELRTRTNRLADFTNVNEVDSVLIRLSDFSGDKLVTKLSKEPGKREARFAHLFSGDNYNTSDAADTHCELDKQGEAAHAKNEYQRAGSNTDHSAEHSPVYRAEQAKSTTNNDDLAKALERICELEDKINQITQRLADIDQSIEILSS